MFDDFDTQIQPEENADAMFFAMLEEEREADLRELDAAHEADWADFERHLDEIEAQAAADQAAYHSQEWEEFYAEIRKNGNTWIK